MVSSVGQFSPPFFYKAGSPADEQVIRGLCARIGLQYHASYKTAVTPDGRRYLMAYDGIYEMSNKNERFSHADFGVNTRQFHFQKIQLLYFTSDKYPKFVFMDYAGSKPDMEVMNLRLFDTYTDEVYTLTKSITLDREGDAESVKHSRSPNLDFEGNERIKFFLLRKSEALKFYETDLPKKSEIIKRIKRINFLEFFDRPAKSYLKFFAALCILTMAFCFAFRDRLLFKPYLSSLSIEAKFLDDYMIQRKEVDLRSYLAARRKSEFFEFLLGIDNRVDYLRQKGYRYHGTWRLGLLPDVTDMKAMYSNCYNYLGRTVANGSYSVYYDRSINSFLVNISHDTSKFTLKIKLDDVYLRFIKKEGFDAYNMGEGYFGEYQYWKDTLYGHLVFFNKGQTYLCSGNIYISENATMHSRLLGLYTKDIILIESRETLERRIGKEELEKIYKFDGEMSDYLYRQQVQQAFRKIVTAPGTLSTLKHELGHAVQYSMRLYSAWEYIARYFETLPGRVIEEPVGEFVNAETGFPLPAIEGTAALHIS